MDFEDFVMFAAQWLDSGGSSVPDITWVTISDLGTGMRDEKGGPIYHGGFSGKMSKYETTNAQFAQYLNAANTSGDITVSGTIVYGANGTNSGADFVDEIYYDLNGAGCDGYQITNGAGARINYNGTWFTVDSGFENYPVNHVSWYGAMAFASHYGWRLPTEWEWQAVADFDGSYNYGCGVSINHNIANYYNSIHNNGTTPWWTYLDYGYGMRDMAGNVNEWTSSVSEAGETYRIFRGGDWDAGYQACKVSIRNIFGRRDETTCFIGFRVCH